MRRLGYLLLACFALYLCTSITQVQPGQRAIVRRWGEIIAVPGPGLHIGLPWGIDRVDRIAVDRLRRIAVGYQPDGDVELEATPPGQLLTGDQNLVNVQVILDFAVVPDKLVDFLVQQQAVEELLARECESRLADWISRRRVDEVLLRGKVELPMWLVGSLNDALSELPLGVGVQSVSVTHLYPPAEVKLSFDEVLRAETAIRQKENMARQQAAILVREAQVEAQRITRGAEAQAHETTTWAKADSDRFLQRLEQYHRLGKENPRYLEALWFDEMGKLFRQLKHQGRIDLLDHHLAGDSLDITIAPNVPKSR